MFRRRKYGISDAVRDVPVGLFCFELLYADGEDLTRLSYPERRARPAEAVTPPPPPPRPPPPPGAPPAAPDAAVEQAGAPGRAGGGGEAGGPAARDHAGAPRRLGV